MPLDPTAIEYLHADPADYVGLIRKVNDRTHPVGSVQVKDLRRMLPGIARFMEQDSYITLNGYYRSARGGVPGCGEYLHARKTTWGGRIKMNVHPPRLPLHGGARVPQTDPKPALSVEVPIGHGFDLPFRG